jgi:hypothetical protein
MFSAELLALRRCGRGLGGGAVIVAEHPRDAPLAIGAEHPDLGEAGAADQRSVPFTPWRS